MGQVRAEMSVRLFSFLFSTVLVSVFLTAFVFAEQDAYPLAGEYHPSSADNWWGYWRQGETLLNLGQIKEAQKSMKLAKKLANQAHKEDGRGVAFLAYAQNFEGNQHVLRGDSLSVLDGKEKIKQYQKAREKYKKAINLQQQPAYYVNYSIVIRRYVRTYIVLNKSKKNTSGLEKTIALLNESRKFNRLALRMNPDHEAAQLELDLAGLDVEYYHSILDLPAEFLITLDETQTLEEALQKIKELEERVMSLEERLDNQ